MKINCIEVFCIKSDSSKVPAEITIENPKLDYDVKNNVIEKCIKEYLEKTFGNSEFSFRYDVK